jgi:hypothetical protein
MPVKREWSVAYTTKLRIAEMNSARVLKTGRDQK